MKNKTMLSILMSLCIILNCSMVTNADTQKSNVFSDIKNEIQPYYWNMYNPRLNVCSSKVEVSLSAKKVSALEINVKVYEEAGNKLLVNKTFSENGRALAGKVNYNFQKGVNYKVVADFYADNEHERLEQNYSY